MVNATALFCSPAHFTAEHRIGFNLIHRRRYGRVASEEEGRGNRVFFLRGYNSVTMIILSAVNGELIVCS